MIEKVFFQIVIFCLFIVVPALNLIVWFVNIEYKNIVKKNKYKKLLISREKALVIFLINFFIFLILAFLYTNDVHYLISSNILIAYIPLLYISFQLYVKLKGKLSNKYINKQFKRFTIIMFIFFTIYFIYFSLLKPMILEKSFNNDKSLLCGKDTLVSKKNGWKIHDKYFIKGDKAINYISCK